MEAPPNPPNRLKEFVESIGPHEVPLTRIDLSDEEIRRVYQPAMAETLIRLKHGWWPDDAE